MKLAVLLFGHLRTFDYSGKFLKKNILDKYDCDVFMHTWDETDSSTQCWQQRDRIVRKVDDDIINKIKKIYNPKDIMIEHQEYEQEIIVTSSDKKKNVSLNGMNFMFRSMNFANELRKKYEREQQFRYDYILVTRPDVAVYNFLDIEETVLEAKNLNLDIDNIRFFAGLYGSSKTNVRLLINRTPDILFFAKPKVIDRYIEVNQFFSKEQVDNKFKNVVSIYTANEIKAGIVPLEICFKCEQDWKNYTIEELKVRQAKDLNSIKNNGHSKLYKFLHLYWLRGKK